MLPDGGIGVRHPVLASYQHCDFYGAKADTICARIVSPVPVLHFISVSHLLANGSKLQNFLAVKPEFFFEKPKLLYIVD